MGVSGMGSVAVPAAPEVGAVGILAMEREREREGAFRVYRGIRNGA
jgi:hypothetical protein